MKKLFQPRKLVKTSYEGVYFKEPTIGQIKATSDKYDTAEEANLDLFWLYLVDENGNPIEGNVSNLYASEVMELQEEWEKAGFSPLSKKKARGSRKA